MYVITIQSPDLAFKRIYLTFARLVIVYVNSGPRWVKIMYICTIISN